MFAVLAQCHPSAVWRNHSKLDMSTDGKVAPTTLAKVLLSTEFLIAAALIIIGLLAYYGKIPVGTLPVGLLLGIGSTFGLFGLGDSAALIQGRKQLNKPFMTAQVIGGPPKSHESSEFEDDQFI